MLQDPRIEALKRLGVQLEDNNKCQILLLPENVFEATSNETVFEAQGTLLLLKYLKEIGVTCATAADFGIKVPTLDRRSGDHWLGVIWIRDKLAIPLLVGVIAGLIVHGITSTQSDTGETHAEIILEDDESLTSIKFRGKGQDLVSIIRALSETSEQECENKE